MVLALLSMVCTAGLVGFLWTGQIGRYRNSFTQTGLNKKLYFLSKFSIFLNKFFNFLLLRCLNFWYHSFALFQKSFYLNLSKSFLSIFSNLSLPFHFVSFLLFKPHLSHFSSSFPLDKTKKPCRRQAFRLRKRKKWLVPPLFCSVRHSPREG